MRIGETLGIKRPLKSNVARRSGAVAGVVAKIVLDRKAVLNELGMADMSFEDVLRELKELPPEMNTGRFRDALLVLLLHEAGIME